MSASSRGLRGGRFIGESGGPRSSSPTIWPRRAAIMTGADGTPAAGPRPVVGRSVVATRYGIVATSHPLAAAAGVRMLERGGTAVDAAIAANAALGVVEPMMCGLGGDLFAIVSDGASGALSGLNASGWSPAGLTRDFIVAQGHDEMPQRGIL